ncbi:unnamed protein product [Plutella xylostella]|uniref:(diamondback moth) hypothetical protein n=1 Tax=Plutella xylostella TaxID=51655 RepID=A0A8S4FWJ0_PLUXY|nr:unnamed protein product [Plutella xylostella]
MKKGSSPIANTFVCPQESPAVRLAVAAPPDAGVLAVYWAEYDLQGSADDDNHYEGMCTCHVQSDAARSRAGNEISSNVDTEGTRRACRRGGETLEMPNVTTSKVRPKPQAIVCKQKPVLSKPSKKGNSPVDYLGTFMRQPWTAFLRRPATGFIEKTGHLEPNVTAARALSSGMNGRVTKYCCEMREVRFCLESPVRCKLGN